jgi:hypothetical protein
MVLFEKKLIHCSFLFLLFLSQADTLEDLNEWKNALENALAQAPNSAQTLGQNGIFRNDPANLPVELPPEQSA